MELDLVYLVINLAKIALETNIVVYLATITYLFFIINVICNVQSVITNLIMVLKLYVKNVTLIVRAAKQQALTVQAVPQLVF
jgi:hypothetical protein